MARVRSLVNAEVRSLPAYRVQSFIRYLPRGAGVKLKFAKARNYAYFFS